MTFGADSQQSVFQETPEIRRQKLQTPFFVDVSKKLCCYEDLRLSQILYQNMDWLKANGHAKWNSANVDFPLKGWKQYDCVSKYLLRAKPAIRRAKPEMFNPVLGAIKEMLDE